MRNLLVPAFFLIGGLVLRADDAWPQFRGPTGQGLANATGVAVEWNATKNVTWKTEISGRGWSSPVYGKGRIYLTTSVGGKSGPISLHALCLDNQDGKILWDTTVFQPSEASARQMHGKNSLASPTPILTDDRLYVHFGHLGTAALDLSGKVLWQENSIHYSPVHGNGGSPILLDNTLIFTCDGKSAPFIAALDAATGQVKWKTPQPSSATKNFSFATPLAIDAGGVPQVIAPASGFVAGYEPASGHELWRVRYGQGYSVVPRPVFADGLLFVSSGFDVPIVYAINPAGASGDVTDSHVAWTHHKGGPCTPSLLAVADELYFVSDIGIASCVDAKTGKVHWTHRLEGSFSASPVFVDGRIYFQSEAGMGIVIKAATQFEQLAENDLGERSLASYAVAGRSLLIRTDHHLWKIDQTGTARVN
jgi:outer membrane protein assembly factor BamB